MDLGDGEVASDYLGLQERFQVTSSAVTSRHTGMLSRISGTRQSFVTCGNVPTERDTIPDFRNVMPEFRYAVLLFLT